MKKYDSYKDSGVDWIGEVPIHWKVTKLKFIGNIICGGTPSTTNEEYWTGNIPWIQSGKVQNNIVFLDVVDKKITENALVESSTKLVKKDSVLIAITGATCSNIGYLTFETAVNQSIVAVEPSNFNSVLLFFLLKSQKEQILFHQSGGAQGGVTKGDMMNIYIPYPTVEEQITIANYLDQKTTQIDDLIAKKEQFIQLLEEERVAVINQAVTKGLDPKVPMKDSGIEWLGEIPEHWEVKKLKFLLNENKDALKTGPFGSHIKNSDYIPNGEFKVYTQRNVLDKEFENGCESITDEKFNELKGFSVFEGDILITTRGSIGRCSVFPKGLPLGVLHPCLIRIQINEKLSLKNWVVNYINNTSLFYNNVKYNSNSTIIDVIYGYTLKEIFFPVPTITEQREILDFLEIKINEIEALISKSQQEIELLKEYKTALISEVVTGKVDVRNEKLN